VTDTGISDYFIFDEQRGDDDDRIPLVSPSAALVPDEVATAADTTEPAGSITFAVPVVPASVVPPAAAIAAEPASGAAVTPAAPAPAAPTSAAPTPEVAPPQRPVTPAGASGTAEPQHATVPHAAVDTRPARLHAALDDLIAGSPDIEAAAVISLDGFTMASALPASMQEDRVGAMSAAILALGERASRELGKGKLTQVFIEGEGGYVMLMAAGSTAVLTCLASEEAKLGLVIYDMRRSVIRVAEIVG
jgi:hypothetical protein